MLVMPIIQEATLPTPALLGIAAGAITLLLVLIIAVRLHAFFSLIIVSILTATAAGTPAKDLLDTLLKPLGDTLSDVALLVGFGAVLGRIIETSGGAQVLADRLIRLFGEKRASLAVSVASLVFGFPIFLDAAFVVFLPIIYTVARRIGGGVLRYALPSLGALAVMHALVPPHPGPSAAGDILSADLGTVLLVGLLVGIPTWYVAGYHLSRWLARRNPEIAVPDILGRPPEKRESLPALWTILLVLLLTLFLILLSTGLSTLQTAGVVSTHNRLVQIGSFIGETPIALLISTLLAMYLLVIRRRAGHLGSALEDIVDSAVAPICAIILITGAGGMFGGVLEKTGIGDAIAKGLTGLGIPVILAAFLIALMVRLAQGSATVAGTTAAGLIAPAVSAANITNPVALAAVVVALLGGAIAASHVNDSGFWLVSRFLGLDTVLTLKTWTIVTSGVGFMAFGLSWLVFLVAS